MLSDRGKEIIILISIYLIGHYLQSHGFGPFWVRFYLKDILLIPILLYAVQIAAQLINLKIEYGSKEIVVALIYVCIVFEIVLPFTSSTYNADWLDIFFYSLGAVYFYIRNRQYHFHISV